MANDTDITFTIGFDVDKAKQKEAFNKMSNSFTNFPLAKLSREEIANQHAERFLNTPEEGVGLFAKANKYRKEQDAMSKLMGISSFPTAPAHEQDLGLKQFEENNAKEQKAFEAKLSALASSLDNSIGSAADDKINGMMKERGINEGLLAKAERHRVASSIEDFIAPLSENSIANAIKTNEINEAERHRVASSIEDFIAPLSENSIANARKAKKEELLKRAKEETHETHDFDDVLNSFGNNANDLNVFEDRNRAYLNLLKQRKDAKKKYGETGDVDALKEYTSADKQIKALKDQEKEKKNNTKEEKGSLLRFGKMLATLHLIKKVLNAIKDIWKRLSDTELKVTSRDVKEKGFFSVDAYSAMHANVDRSHAVISRGLGYMGAAAPFSMESFDSVLQQLQDLNLKAISGQGIADDQLVISLQRLSDTLGLGFNIKDILTDPNLNLTDFLTNLMNSVEKFLPKLNSLDDIKKSLVTNDIIKALGPELANALVYNYNYNQRNGGTSTVMDLVTSKGTNAYGLIDYTEEAKKFTDALASSRAAVDDFKVALGGVFAPTGKKILDQVTEKTAEGTMFVNAINAIKSKIGELNFTLAYSGVSNDLLNPFSNASRDREEQSEWYKKEKNQEDAATKLEEASKQMKTPDDYLNFVYYNPTALAAGTSGNSLEQAVSAWKAYRLLPRIKGQTKGQLEKDKANFSDSEWEVIKKLYKLHGKDWTFDGTVGDIRDAWQYKFAQGKEWDTKPGTDPVEYAKEVLGGEEEYKNFIIRLLSEENNLWQQAGVMKPNGFSYPSTDESGNKITGTINIKIDKTDGTSSYIPAEIENGVLKALANSVK